MLVCLVSSLSCRQCLLPNSRPFVRLLSGVVVAVPLAHHYTLALRSIRSLSLSLLIIRGSLLSPAPGRKREHSTHAHTTSSRANGVQCGNCQREQLATSQLPSDKSLSHLLSHWPPVLSNQAKDSETLVKLVCSHCCGWLGAFGPRAISTALA